MDETSERGSECGTGRQQSRQENRVAHLERGVTAYRELNDAMRHQTDEPGYAGRLFRARHEVTEWEKSDRPWVDHGADGVTCNADGPDNLRCNRLAGHAGRHHFAGRDW